MTAQRRLIAFLLTLSLLPTGVAPLTGTAVPSFQAESDLFRAVPKYSIDDSGFPAAAAPVVPSPVPGSVSVRGTLHSAPLVFIENVGQFDEQARFQVRGRNATVHLTDDAVWLTLLEKPSPTRALSAYVQGGAAPLPTPESGREVEDEGQSRQGVNLKFSFLGANRHSQLEPFNPLDLHLSFFLSSDSANWRADVPTWGGVRYRDLYPGVDLEMIGEDSGWRWRLMARRGAHLDVVRLQVEGTETVTVDSSGRLRMQTAVGSLTGPALTAQHGHVPMRPVIADNTVRFVPSPQGAARPATVPMESATSVGGSGELVYSTFLGGNGFDAGNAIAAGSDGTAYVTGETYSTDFPTTPGAFDTALDGSRDIFVTNLQSAGNTPAFSTFLGGDSDDRGYAIALDDTGSVYLVGSSSSSNFPITEGAYSTVHNGGEDAVVVKLNATGSALLYSTYLGGSLDDLGLGLAVDGAGAVYIAGHTASPGFPTTPDAFDTSWGGGYPYSDAFVTKLDPAGTALEYSTFLGGTGEDYANNIAVDSSGSAYVVGWTNSKYFPTTPGSFGTTRTKPSDAFVAKLNGSGSDLVYSGLLGGSQNDQGQGIVVDGLGAAYLTGQTSSVNFPVTPGAYQIIKPSPGGVWDGFVAKVSSDGATLIYSTYLGGSTSNCESPGTHRECVIALDASGAACVVGRTLSADFPTTPDGFDVTYNGNEDGFVAALSPDGSSLVYGSFIGGASSDQALAVALDTTGLVYVSGRTDSSDFPTSTGAFDGSYSGGGDAFVAKLPRVTVPQRTCYVRLSDDPTDYDTVQSAVDASAHVTDVVKVAGYCAGINDYGGLRQVVYVSKTLTLRGGYTTTNWIEPDPAANPTTLDARGQGRVLYITGEISPTIEGLRITGGDATGLGGWSEWDAGGGMYVITATATISNNRVFSNTAYTGAGLYLSYSAATLRGNTVSANGADHSGGGVCLFQSHATLSGDIITGNVALFHGGGLYLDFSDARLTNTIVAHNQADVMGSGLYIYGSSPHLLHTTIVSNTGGEGSGLHITDSELGDHITVALTNTILVSHTVGITVTSGNTATLQGTLWYGNGQDTGGLGGIVAGTVNVHGDPAFLNPGMGDYHIGAASAAIDAGVGAGVSDDIDGDPRPYGYGVDIGADEYVGPFAPSMGTFEPDGGSGRVGQWIDFTTTYTDPNGYQDIVWAFFFLDRRSPMASGGLVAAYIQSGDLLWLRGGEPFPVCLPGQPTMLTTEYVTLDCQNSSVSGEDATLTIHWQIRPERCFDEDCGWNYGVEFVKDSAGLQDAGLVGWWRLDPAGGTAQTPRPAS